MTDMWTYWDEVEKRDTDAENIPDGEVRPCPRCKDGELNEEVGWLYNIDRCNKCGWLTMV